MQDFFDITVNLSRFLLACSFVLALIKFKLFTKVERWYISYLFLVFCIEGISYAVGCFKSDGSNTFLYPIYIAGEFFTISGIFLKKLKVSNFFFMLTGLLSLFFLKGEYLLTDYEYKDDYSKAISNVIIICLSGYTLLQEIRSGSGKDRFLIVDKMIFLYFGVSIFIFMFQHQLMKFPISYFTAFWMINNIMCCVLYGLFLKTIIQLKK